MSSLSLRWRHTGMLSRRTHGYGDRVSPRCGGTGQAIPDALYLGTEPCIEPLGLVARELPTASLGKGSLQSGPGVDL